ncbi:PhoX family phosphatase [Hahella sp. CR1]|uniref:PhoX family protein n=1 Tax=Hahella sp. CR1 TaxID=2992807 RepID=UPI0024429EF2|nr:PhoX family phosphatase [Hahella sp. CR1]MDG9666955.1 PhoX family phosphatase [Hahella sp. CR1]
MSDIKKFEFDNSGIDPVTNFSGNRPFASVLETRIARRTVIKGGVSAALAGMLGMSLIGCSNDNDGGDPDDNQGPLLGFTAIATSVANEVKVAAGYTATPFVPWGTPLTGALPDYLGDGTNTGADQEQQVGMNHDGMHYFPIDVKEGGSNSEEGLLVMNHEYIEPDFLHPDGPTEVGGVRPEAEVHKEVAAHGVSVIHIKKTAGVWDIVHGSQYNRRVTGATDMELRGPVRGTNYAVTKHSNDGTLARGTLNNCSMGYTPWGTYLACEENWAGYFKSSDDPKPRNLSRYGVGTRSRYGWDTVAGVDVYERFDASSKGASAVDDYRNEPNTYGWIVEIDPFEPTSTPQKRTALGRFGHEGIIFGLVEEGKPIVCYSGDDSRFEYIYKYVSNQAYYADTASGALLDDGKLYVAKFNDDGSGEWLELSHGVNGLTVANGFADQADILINARTAADSVGATPMDRPEWGAVHPTTGEAYFTLTNNSKRKEDQVDAANPRPNNQYGHIIRWRENSDSVTAFQWDIFVLGGPAGTATPGESAALVTLDDSNKFNSPDGLWFDKRGVLWIQTDTGGTEEFGNDQMLAADPSTREIRRFFTGVVDCEVTGVTSTPDLKTMFVNVQHPGSKNGDGSYTSNWPDGGSARPRASTVIITKDDGGVIGS